jgi:hypothetical protein
VKNVEARRIQDDIRRRARVAKSVESEIPDSSGPRRTSGSGSILFILAAGD